MIFAARVLHEKTPEIQEPRIITFLADTSYAVYLFHWPFYIIFSQLMTNGWASLLTTIVSFSLAALSFYIIEPTLAGRQPKIFGLQMDLRSITRPIFYSAIPLTLLMFGIILFTSKKEEQVELLDLKNTDIHIAEYMMVLPSKEVLEYRLHLAVARARERFLVK